MALFFSEKMLLLWRFGRTSLYSIPDPLCDENFSNYHFWETNLFHHFHPSFLRSHQMFTKIFFTTLLYLKCHLSPYCWWLFLKGLAATLYPWSGNLSFQQSPCVQKWRENIISHFLFNTWLRKKCKFKIRILVPLKLGTYRIVQKC